MSFLRKFKSCRTPWTFWIQFKGCQLHSTNNNKKICISVRTWTKFYIWLSFKTKHRDSLCLCIKANSSQKAIKMIDMNRSWQIDVFSPNSIACSLFFCCSTLCGCFRHDQNHILLDLWGRLWILRHNYSPIIVFPQQRKCPINSKINKFN